MMYSSLYTRVPPGQQRSYSDGPAHVCQRAGGADRPHGKNTEVLLYVALHLADTCKANMNMFL